MAARAFTARAASLRCLQLLFLQYRQFWYQIQQNFSLTSQMYAHTIIACTIVVCAFCVYGQNKNEVKV